MVFSTTSFSLRIDLYNPTKPFTVAGWGNGNTIGFSGLINSFSYNIDTLTINAGGFTYNIVIGTGYDVRKMYITHAEFGNGAAIANTNFGLKYSGPVPHTVRPSVCVACPKMPAVPF